MFRPGIYLLAETVGFRWSGQYGTKLTYLIERVNNKLLKK